MIEKQTNFGKISTKLPLPDLLDMQKQSFVDFLQLDVPPSKRELKGLQAAFEDVFPIEAPDGSMRLDFLKSVMLLRPKPPCATVLLPLR